MKPVQSMLLCAAFALAANLGWSQSPPAPPVEFIDTGFENASPLWYDVAADDTIQIHLNYDHERSSLNRAAGHIHFRIHATRGAKFTLEFLNLENVWNGQPGSVARELKAVVISEDGRQWRSVATTSPAEEPVPVIIALWTRE